MEVIDEEEEDQTPQGNGRWRKREGTTAKPSMLCERRGSAGAATAMTQRMMDPLWLWASRSLPLSTALKRCERAKGKGQGEEGGDDAVLLSHSMLALGLPLSGTSECGVVRMSALRG